MAKLVVLALSTALVFACGPRVSSSGDAGITDGDAPPSDRHVLTAIEVTPTNPILELDLGQPGSQAFLATGRYLDGVDEDLSARVTWEVSNPAVGAMAGSTLDIPAFNAVSVNVAQVTAKLDGAQGLAQITVVAYRKTGVQQDFFFVLPYQDPAGPAQKPLAFSTDVPALDVFFNMDNTGSMIGEITNLRTALTGTVVPGIRTEVPDSHFGVGSFEDFPVSPYGTLAGSDCYLGGGSPLPDQPFHLRQAVTMDVTAVATAMDQYSVGGVPSGCGEDWPEAAIESIFQIGSGQGLTGPGATSVPANTSGVGGVGFRAGTMPVVVSISDAVSHAPGEATVCSVGSSSWGVNYTDTSVFNAAHTRAQAKAALGGICARSVGVASIEPVLAGNADCTAQRDLEDFATATGARVPPSAWDVPARPSGCAAGQCCTNFNGTGRAPDTNGLCPLVFLTDEQGTGLGTHIVTGIKMLTRFATFDVTSDKVGAAADVNGVPLPSPYTTADFIKQVIPQSFTLPPPPPNLPNPTYDAVSFFGVTPGTEVRFFVRALNDFLPQTGDAQIFRATIRVLAGGCTALDQREVLILVPPTPIVIQ